MKVERPAAEAMEYGAEIGRFSKAKTIAQKLGVCPRTVFRWADRGMLARHKINERVVLFDEGEVLALIRSTRLER